MFMFHLALTPAREKERKTHPAHTGCRAFICSVDAPGNSCAERSRELEITIAPRRAQQSRFPFFISRRFAWLPRRASEPLLLVLYPDAREECLRFNSSLEMDLRCCCCCSSRDLKYILLFLLLRVETLIPALARAV